MSQQDVPIRLWENARVLSMTDEWTGGHVAGDGSVLVQGERILAVGPRSTWRRSRRRLMPSGSTVRTVCCCPALSTATLIWYFPAVEQRSSNSASTV
ncbi:MAG: hypothetical protein Ct9H300mP16_04550 [Pseudomonadota bacterium]|nr:MAG: hypothetical protein Ct9H300mP16_04550 [Pseudomonadota bacterium]